jgi:hypothetical protein
MPLFRNNNAVLGGEFRRGSAREGKGAGESDT